MIAVILAAGRGTRMGPLTANVPKPLLSLRGRPIIEHILTGLRAAGVREAVVVTGYLAEHIERHLGSGEAVGMRLSYRRQTRPEGTARALLLARDTVGDEPFLLSWGDIVIEPGQYAALLDDYRRVHCDALLGVNATEDPWQGAAVYVDKHLKVTALLEKPARGSSRTPWNNAGIFVFAPLVLEYAERLSPSARGEYELPQAIAAMIADGHDVRAYPVRGFWSDLGRPEDLAAAETALGSAGLSHNAVPSPSGRGSGRGDQKLANLTTEGRYTSDDRRTTRLVNEFARRYGRAPAFIVAAPGRVNLLGEHTDYNGLPVLPMAIDRNTLIAGVPRADRVVTLQNIETQFAARQYELNEDIRPFTAGDWGNYSKAAAQGLVRYCGGQLRYGAELLVDGNIPCGAGLSSSAALVVGNALALLAANEVDVPYVTLAELLPIAERYVGTLSGGMDQAICLLAQPGHALRIDFFPLRVRTVPLPRGYSVVVCHSLVQAEKSGVAQRGYNLRVIECHLACRVLERTLGSGLPHPLRTLGDLATLFPGRPLAEFVSLAGMQVPDRPLSLAQIATLIGTAPERLRSECQVTADLGDRFTLLRRLRHVLREAERVDQAEEALRAGDAHGFGRLMDASHQSCRDDYEISCAELEELVHVAKEAGAVGARLTGAGFGGCTVNLVADSEVYTFLARVDRSFYRPRLGAAREPNEYRFIFKPQSGAEVRRL